MVPTIGIVKAEQIEHIVIVRQITVGHALNSVGTSKHFVVDVSFVGKTGHGSDLVLKQMGLEHTTEVVLVFDWIPFEHTTSQHTITVLVVADNLVNSGDTSGNTPSGGFNDLLENRKVEVCRRNESGR